MLRYLQTCLVLIFYFLFIRCEIPGLSVRKVDSKYIERKRLDTLEICRLFNEENKQRLALRDNEPNTNDNDANRRIKREIDSSAYNNPLLNNEDIVRIENIVDKHYDEILENGKKVSYRRINLKNITTTAGVKKTNRRFHFAPANLTSNMQKSKESKEDDKKEQGDRSKEPWFPWIKKWKYGIIPFFIDPKTYDSYLAGLIIEAFDAIEKATCIRLQQLRERPTDKESMQQVEWLYITNPNGIKQCVHSNERKENRGVQMVVFGYHCLSHGEIAHEIMHVLGFSHEHNRYDRDLHITIHWENIKPGYKKYFELKNPDILSNLPYDYDSVLHYPARAFSKNGQITIATEGQKPIGQRNGLSEIDVAKIDTIFAFECTQRNQDYLKKTCPSVIKQDTKPAAKATPKEVEDYFKNKIWPFGVVLYRIIDEMEFSIEEKENIEFVIAHIEKETCIIFRDISHKKEQIAASGEMSDNEKLNQQQTEDGETTILLKNNGTTDNVVQKLTHTVDMQYFWSTQSPTDDKTTIQDQNLENEIIKPNVISSPNSDTAKNSTEKSRRSIFKGSQRRHAVDVLILKKSHRPGCPCPKEGRLKGIKIIKIGQDCFTSVNHLLHFFVHILGLEHQHNMHDRDSFVHIDWNKITPELIKEMKRRLPPAASAGFAYDYQSVMHFPWLNIQKGVSNIMYPIWNDGWAMGNWQGLSATDVLKLNRIYEKECSKRKVVPRSTTTKTN